METRTVLLADAFANEPLAGVPIAVVPDGVELTAAQRRKIASELGATGTVTPTDGDLRFTPIAEDEGLAAAAVGGCLPLLDRELIDEDSITLRVDSEGTALDGEYALEIGNDQRVSIEFPMPEITGPTVRTDEIASALGVDTNALADIGADLPQAQATGFGGTVFVPVNFLEHLSGASPNHGEIESLLAATEATRLCAFTFDTLDANTDVHARIFDPRVDTKERAASGVAGVGCATYLASHEVFDGDKLEMGIESGHFIDRPSTLRCDLTAPRVSGFGLTVLDGQLSLPEDDTDDEIIQA
jgi:trans-2,3-dihydro-3-hydroxyanthranilate isomerase